MKELPKTYEPQKIESEIYRQWEESGYFQPEADQHLTGNPDPREIYCNVLPPPNANGELHIGHASGYTVMDIFGRYARMNGKKTLLLPGKDHAGIQTQVVFEKKLQAEEGLSRQEIGREDFYKKTYDFCIDRANYMRSQEKKIGISADWSREKFTLDPDVLKTALETFVKMHQDGLIYKGKRIINWCPRCGTALSDVEVLHKETPGKLYFIKYPIENSADFITVATTRPETMLGDTAVAVNPKDKRYLKLVGKNIVLPLQNTIIPIIADKRIDLSFGTGAVKITPSHDPLDWEIGKDHKLDEIQIIDEKALIAELGGKYAGLTVHEAREEIIKDLEKLNLLEKIEEMTHSVSICERCKTIIEPLTSNQWFINVDAKNFSLKKKAIEAIKKNEIEIFPNNFQKILIDWFDNMRDWCISRQIWWGPRFPVWYRTNSQLTTDNSQQEPEMYVGLTPPEGKGWVQDKNTFDTWFTSSQWAYTTLKSKEKDFEMFYPTNTMVMGRDLLFFWSSRMIMMSLYTTEKIPFKNLFFTGLVLDKDGHKLSKSRGNGIDPLTVIEKFGADALRMSLIMESSPGQDSRLYAEKIETFRNFANKLWNVSRYCLTQENFRLQEKIEPEEIVSLADQWIVDKLIQTTSEVTHLFETKQIALAADKLKTFTWNEFADWYLEINKIEKNQKVLGFVLDKLLRLWHPFMPFITEHIWSLAKQEKMLMISSWPDYAKQLHLNSKQDVTTSFELLVKDLVIAIRNARTENKIEAKQKINVIIDTKLKQKTKTDIKEILESQTSLIKGLRTGIESLEIATDGLMIENAIQRTVAGMNIYIPLAGLVDQEKERVRLNKEIENVEKFISGLESRLENKDFISKAPEQVINQQKESLSRKAAELVELKKQLASLV